MKNLTVKQIVTPLATLSIICLMYFGPITRSILENIIISVIIIGANFLEYNGKPFEALGLYRKNFTAKNLLVYAPITAFTLFTFYVAVLVPAIEWITGVSIDYSSMSQLKGDLSTTLIWLAIVWLTAGFGEEIIFRGFFMRQFVKFFGEGKISLILNILIFSSIFGYMHMQQGITGQIVAGTTGAFFSMIFIKKRYDLWFMIMLHGSFNTLGIFSFYFGLA
ncbi:MAG: CPBP family intramembrane metalloprotease [Bacteroidia bacterium]